MQSKMISYLTSAKCRQFLVSVCFGPISFGAILGWTSPVLPQLQNNNFTLPINLTVSEGSWVGSMLAVGVILSAVPAGFLGDRFGTKKCLVYSVIPGVIFTLIVVFTHDVYLLCVGRFAAGVAAGAFSALSPSYLGESSHPSRRAVVASFFEFLIYGGVLLVSICGAYVDYVTLTVMYCIVTVLTGVALCFFPESPMYLLRTNRREEATEALKFYRSKSFDVNEAIADMQKTLLNREKINVRKSFASKAVRRGLLVCFGLTAFQQFAGIDPITFYNVQIWQAADTGMDPYTLAIILSTVQFLSHVTIIVLAEKAPRRVLMSYSSAVCGLSLFLLGIYFHLRQYGYYVPGMNYMPLMCLSVFLIAYSCGIGPIPWLVNGELFPAGVKCVSGGMIATVHWILLFFNAKAFPVVMESIGPQYPFYFFGLCMIACIVFIKFYVPETWGKSLEQIQMELNG